jgi:hypothetical protein
MSEAEVIDIAEAELVAPEAPVPEGFDEAMTAAKAGDSTKLCSQLWDIPFEKYLESKALSSHGLMDLLRSPAHYYAKTFLGLDKDTPAKRRGRLLHTAVLEPKRFREKFKLAPAEKRNTKIGKDKYARFIAGIKPGDIIVTPEEAVMVTAMIAALRRHPVAWNLILHGESEMSGWWQDEKGYLCKWRPDKNIRSHSVIVDYKTAKDASFDGFRKAIFNMKYDMQAYWYTQGANRMFNTPVRKFIFIAQEPEPPYAVGVYVANDSVYQLGERRVLEAKARYEQCLERDQAMRSKGKDADYIWEEVWNAYDPSAVDMDIPQWAFAQVVDEDDI